MNIYKTSLFIDVFIEHCLLSLLLLLLQILNTSLQWLSVIHIKTALYSFLLNQCIYKCYRSEQWQSLAMSGIIQIRVKKHEQKGAQ